MARKRRPARDSADPSRIWFAPIEKMLSSDFGGSVAMEFNPSGVVCRFGDQPGSVGTRHGVPVDELRLMDHFKRNAVLIVDDEPILRLQAIDIVEEAGFVPIEATDADEAIAILKSRSDIVLLLTDVHMPGSIDGLKLAHYVRDRWPPIKIIVVSGRVKLSKSEMPAGGRFFGKPFEAGRMVSALRSMIGA